MLQCEIGHTTVTLWLLIPAKFGGSIWLHKTDEGVVNEDWCAGFRRP